jgi:quinol-cytochrome oxidoreductase complex cytochrome b subunit
MNDEERLWARRFGLFALLRISGLLLFFLGMTIAFSDLLQPGGQLAVGMVVIGLGLVEALLGPVLLRQLWEKKDRR